MKLILEDKLIETKNILSISEKVIPEDISRYFDDSGETWYSSSELASFQNHFIVKMINGNIQYVTNSDIDKLQSMHQELMKYWIEDQTHIPRIG